MYRATIAADYIFGDDVRKFIDQLFGLECQLHFIDSKYKGVNERVNLQLSLSEE